MRVLLFTGKGGVGKTTVAAATAVRAADAGLRTIVCSTDPAHSLADVFDVPLGDAPSPLPSRGTLDGQQLDARARLEASWGAVRQYLTALLGWAGAETIEAEELAVIPGLDEVFALVDVRAHAEAYDVVVVDCAPTAETLRLLSLPDVLGWYMSRVFPAQRSMTRVVRPLLTRMMTMPVADEGVFAAVRDLYDGLDGVRELLADSSITSARLVVNPERMVVAETRRTFTYLSMFGYHVDAVIANRMLPGRVADPWFDEWKRHQREHLAEIESAFVPLPVLVAELCREEPIGAPALAVFGDELYGGRDPIGVLGDADPLRVEAIDGAIRLSLRLPFVAREDVELARRNEELLLTVGSYRRAVVLPDSLRRREVAEARMTGDRLEVDFVEPAPVQPGVVEVGHA